ncbi:MAG: hypothetical protein D6686_07750 [Alphaproteobacteria bacterium]|nr:MAG: hypothetical protein D6686_07750 [Alphaproteobacteria bacterium]
MKGATPAWDFDGQRRDSAEIFRELQRESGLAPGTPITLDLHFVPGEEDADEAGFVAALERAGFDVVVLPEDGTVEASVPGVPFEADAIWRHEERATRIALSRGYDPDGWGFYDPHGEEAGAEDPNP